MSDPTHILDDAPGQLGELAGELGVSLAQWSYRDTAADKAAARRAASTAVAAMDSMLRMLYQARQQLTGEVRAADDEHARHVDELLACYRAERAR